MNNTADFNELKSILSETLQYFELSDSLIDQLLSDNFINGLLELQQQEPVNNSFISMLRNFSDEQNLCTAKEFEEELHSELCKDGYVKSVVQYINNSWLDIPFPGEIQTRSNNSIVENAKRGISIVGAMLSTLAKRFNIACTNFAGNLNQYISIAQRLDKRINDDYAIARQFDENLRAVALGIRYNTKTGENTRSPLVVDLDGDGVETIGTNSNVYFDHDNNGFAESTGWVGKDDGLLVRDLNNNGQIDDGTELFGNNSVLSSGEKAANGFEALKDLDSNNDGIFNSSDTAWNQVKVWKDANSNGVVDEGELLTLEQAGIENIDLNYQNSNAVDTNGNTVGQIGSFDKENGTQGNISDIWFNTDLMDTVDKTNIDIPADIAALPNVTGFGNVHDLHTAMALDTSGELKALVQQYAAETDSEARQQILYNIIYHWTGVQDEPIDGRDPTQVYGKVIDDTRKLEALEEFMGEEYLGTWCWGERDPNPHGKAAPYILRAFDILAEYVNNELLAQTHYKPLLENVKLIWDNTTETWSIDVSGAVAQIQSLYNENAENGITTLREFEKLVKNCGYDNLQAIYEAFRTYGSLTGSDLDAMFAKFGYTYGTDLNDDLTGTAGVDEINGLAGNDSIYGGAGNDTLDGGTGNDNIFGENGDDILIGGEGNDYLIGGNGADTYIFNPGFGNDAIDNSDDSASASEPDIIQFGEGILASKTTLGRQGYDLIITVSYDPDENGTTRPNDSIRVYSYFDQQGTSSATVNSIVFADGTTWDYEYVRDHWNSIPDANGGETLEGNNENNTINGTNYNDILIGNGGNDTINAGNGNDRLLGGTGNDTLNGGSGDDTYLWNWGDGMDTISDTGNHDKISFGDGITYSDLKFRQEGGNLRITVKNNENQGMLINGFFSSLDYKIEDLYFQDGSIVHLSEIPLTLHQLNTDETINLTGNGDTVYANGGDDRVNGGQGNDTIFGGDGNDNIYGNSGNDVISGGKGDDTIDGGNGADTYIWNLGDGLDTIEDYQGSSTDGRMDSVSFGQGISFEDLTFECSGSDLIIYVKGDRTQGVILRNQFNSDYYRIEYLELADGTVKNLTEMGFTFQQTDRHDNVTGTQYDDIIYGNGGNDTLNAGNGNDILVGSKGDDSLDGGYGNDTYVWNLGDGFDTISDYQSSSTEGLEDKIKFGEGITFEDLSFENSGNNLIIYVNGDKTQGLQLNNYFYGSNYTIEILEFADGSTVNLTQIGLTFQQQDNSETITGTAYDDVIYANGGNDTVNAGSGNDAIYGGIGNDTLNGQGGNDTFVGGKGNDSLDGGSGDDTYIYNLGDGYDIISDSSGNDKIKFGEGISFADLKFANGDNNSLLIFLSEDKTEAIQINNFISNGNYRIEQLEFADGTTKNLSEMGLTFDQYDCAETITGTDYDDVIYGNGGNDTLYGGNGNDILSGGTGHDRLEGGSGDDTYVWNLNDGIDTISDYQGTNKIKFGANIAQANLSFAQVGNNLRIIVNNDPSQGLIIESYYSDTRRQIETIEFADGSEVSVADLIGNLVSLPDQVIEGTADDDILTGGNGNDTINAGDGYNDITGGKGNDTLNGGYDKDTYYYNLGDGYDTISDPYGRDKIIFGEGISPSDLIFQRNGDDLFISFSDNDNDGIRILQHFYNDDQKIEQLEFADGSTINLSKGGLVLQGTDKDNTIDGTSYNDTIYGGLGRDVIDGGKGVDIINGGKGDDTIDGGAGEDTIIWNLGDDLDTVTFSDVDHLKFGEGITFEDLTFYAEGNNLRIVVKGDMTQGVICRDYFYSNNNKPENIIFADGSVYSLQQSGLIIHHGDRLESISGTDYADTIYGGKGNNTISGGDGNDIIYGEDGDDTISGGRGTDTIVGGKGNDTIDGGTDADTFIWNLGDDLDTITASNIDKLQFGEGITKDSLTFRGEGNNLHIIINNDETQGIILVNFFYNSDAKLNHVSFADGSSLNLATIGLTLDQQFSKGDTINGTDYDDIINAHNTYSVTINAGDGSDTINAGDGNDTVNAGNGNNIIRGGKGNDSLNAGSGNDTYFYNLGDGFDTISDSAGNDKIIFGNGILPEDLTFTQNGYSLIITVKEDTSQGIEILNYYNGNPLEELHFADGSVKLLPQMDITLQQGNGDETVNGTDSNETIYGNDGNDTINGNYGDDVLIGGAGNDTLDGGGDNDTYIYNLGDGLDTIYDNAGSNKIVFGEGIAQNNLSFTQIDNNLLIYLNGDKNQGIIIKSFFSSDSYKIGEIHFADNSVFYLSETGLTLDQSNRNDDMTINGTDYDDTIIGGSGNDTINAGDDDDIITGGKGNDTLNGGYGRDTYIYNLGDGVDTISETRGNDKIKFGSGIVLDDLKFTQEGNDLRIIIKNDVSQSILIDDFYRGTNYQVETLQFADGSTFNLSTQGITLQQTDADDTVNGTSYNDVIYGNGGHDTINAGEGNDTIVGGIGNDILNGGNGDDTYIYNLGDGFDTITESGGNDKIVFGEGISQSDLSFEKIGNDLKISINGNEVKGIQINDHFRYDSSKVETIEFHDGSTLDISNADQLIQAMNSFSVSNSASTDTLSNPTEDVSDMYSLAASQDLTRKAI